MWTPPLNPVSKCPLPRPPANIWALTTYSGHSEIAKLISIKFSTWLSTFSLTKRLHGISILARIVQHLEFLNGHLIFLQQIFALVFQQIQIANLGECTLQSIRSIKYFVRFSYVCAPFIRGACIQPTFLVIKRAPCTALKNGIILMELNGLEYAGRISKEQTQSTEIKI